MIDLGGVSSSALLNQQNSAAQSARSDVPDIRASKIDNVKVEIPAVDKGEQIRPDTEDRRFARVEQASRKVVSEFFPINDMRFTIFKDGSGQYITRFTNLKDGSVTFYPEPNLLAAAGAVPDSLYKTNA
jgi:ABC-type Zn2+ transport system substrate-binding protein/surface adhesin